MNSRRLIIRFISGLALLLFTNIAFSQYTLNYYVDASKTVSGNGNSWVTAFKTLKEAVDSANQHSAHSIIYVAKGTYYPTGQQNGTNRDATFLITKGNLEIYGGYPNGGGIRNLKQNPTILSGDISAPNVRADNSYHIMTISGGINYIIDGFVFQYGQADGSGSLNVNGESVDRDRAGALAIWYANSGSEYAVLVQNCIFRANVASDGGGSVFTENSNVSFNNCLFSGNKANYGGGILAYFINNISPSVSFNFCTFSGNNATNTGGAIRFSGTNAPIIKNSIIWDNSNGISTNNSSNPNYSYSLIQGMTSTANNNLNGDLPSNNPYFTTPLDYNQAPSIDGDFHILPVLVTCLNAANLNDLTPNHTTDLDGNARLMGCGPDLGAYEARVENFNIYVDSTNGNDNNSGNSWATAYKTMTKAFEKVSLLNCSPNIFNIYVAKGTYFPTGQQNSTNRDAAFVIPQGGVKIYGGYPSGGGPRDLKFSETIFSGNIGSSGLATDNSYHVMVVGPISKAMDSVVIDGIKIRDGNASGSGTFAYNGTNLARNTGGGVYLYQVGIDDRMVFRNSQISGNQTSTNGGGLNIQSASPTFINSLGNGNVANQGGAFANTTDGAPKLIQCTIAGNKAPIGAACRNINTNLTVLNSIIWGNQTTIENISSTSTVQYSLVTGIDTLNQNHNINAAPYFYNPVSYNNAPTSEGNYRLQQCSSALDAANNNFLPTNTPADYLGNPRIINSTVDMGAFERNGNYGAVRYYVKQDATGSGSSWADASGDLQEMINQSCEGTEIWVAAGTYKPIRPALALETISVNNLRNAFVLKSGVKIYGGFPNSGNPTMNSRNWENNPTILSGDLGISGDNTDNALHVVISAGYAGNSELNGFTISGGNANTQTMFGPVGIFINDENVDNNGGGGIYINNASPKIVNCKIIDNLAEYYGGGIFVRYGNPTFENCDINANSCSDYYGGGISLYQSQAVLENCFIRNNQAFLSGGAIYSDVSTTQISNTIISNNMVQSGSGGGLFIGNSSTSKLMQCLVTNNKSNGNFGGGIYSFNYSTIDLINTTIAGNEAGQYGEFYQNLFGLQTVKNSIIWGNGSTIDGFIAQNSLIQGINDTTNGNISGTIDPQFVDTANQNYTLSPCSPLINAGNTDTSGLNLSPIDLNGNPRIFGGRIDIGTYESQVSTAVHASANGVLFVDSAVNCFNNTGGSWEQALSSFSQALSVADSLNSHASQPSDSVKQIWVAKGTYQPVQNSSFTMIKNVKIYGGFAGTETSLNQRNLNAGFASILKGNGKSVINNDDNGLSNTALLDGFTISNGNGQKGGGVYNNNVSPSFANCIFINNHADVQGGGMHNEFSSNPIISNCIFQNNDAGIGGGGVFNYYGSSPNISQSRFIGNSSTNGGGIGTNNNANATIVNCEFKWNTASGGGGAINNNTSDGVKIINSLFIRNKAADNGGGVNNINSSSFIVNCTFSQDTATAGGAINNANSNPVIKNCIISGNTSGIANSNATPVITYSLIQGMVADTMNHILDGNLPPGFFDVINDSYGLSSCSPAINSGDADTTGLGLLTVDLSGQPRVYGGVIDMGVFEAQITPYHTDDAVLETCANNQDANPSGTFDLTTAENNINHTDNPTFSYYSDISLNNPIINPTVYVGYNNNKVYAKVSFGACFKIATITLQVRNLPTVIATATTTNVHQNQPVTLTGSGAVSYTWDQGVTDGVPFMLTQTTLFTVTGTDGYGCQSSDSILLHLLAPGRVYVDSSNVTGTHDGLSWSTAYNKFEDGMNNAFLGDTVFVAKGTYQPASGQFFSMKEGVKIYGGFQGGENNLSERNLSLGDSSILKGNGNSVIRNDNNGLTNAAVLDGFKITEGGGGSVYFGGGIYNSHVSPILSNLTIIGNTAGVGGGIFNEYATALLLNHVVVNNNAAGTGGGVVLENSTATWNHGTINGNIVSDPSGYAGGVLNSNSSLQMTDVTINGNSCTQSGGGVYNAAAVSLIMTNVSITGNSGSEGGGIFNMSSAPILTNVTINQNIANNGNGGGVYNSSSTPVFINATINGNTATGMGGGIFNLSSYTKLTDVEIRGNSATSGGGICGTQSSFSDTLTNVLISGNKSTNTGGGIYNGQGAIFMTNVTIAGNMSDLGGGGIYSSSAPILFNSMILGNKAGQLADGLYSTALNSNSSKNLIQTGNDTTGGAYNATGDTVANTSPDFIFTDFVSPDFAPTTAGDYTLKQGSFAIDRGDSSLFSGLNANTKDIDSNDRVIGINIDLGTYEYQIAAPPIHRFYVDSLNVSGFHDGFSWGTAFNKFEDGINAAQSGDTVFVARGTYKPANGQSYTMKAGVKIYGGFAGTENSLAQRDLSNGDTSYLIGNGNSVIRNENNNLTPDAVLDGFKIAGGNSPTSGGGIYNSSASPTLSNLTISGNSVAYFGGGIYNVSSNPIITNVIVSGNFTPALGGGIANYSSSPILTNVLISGNLSSSVGGGMYNDQTCTPILTNVTISGNMATNGGGIFNEISSSNSLKLFNSIILGNSSGIQGTILNSSSSHNLIQTGDENSAADFDNASIPNSTPNDIFINPITTNSAPTSDGNYQLKQGSFAVNNGDNTLYVNLTPETKDLAGNNRVMGSVIDLGPYEVPLIISRYYVDSSNVSGLHNGLSWATAFNKFEDVLDIAQTGDTVFVAKGTYQPSDSGDYFSMKQGVKIFGGFSGTETSLDQRNIGLGDTSVLLGNGNSVIRNVSNGLTATAVLDGFKITGGNTANQGGGLYNENVSPTLNNLWITGNQGGLGGGLYNFYSSPTLTDVVINENQSSYGGGIYDVASSPVLTNVMIEMNNSGYGGGIYNALTSSPVLTNVIISGNSASSYGGGIYNNNYSNPQLTNVALTGNMANSGGGMYNSLNSSAVLTNVTISGNLNFVSGGGIYNDNSSPILSNTIVLGNTTGIEGDPINSSSSHNLLQTGDENSGGEFNGTGGEVAQTTPGNIFVNPITPIQPDITGIYRLKPGAFAIDKGDNSLFLNLSPGTKDVAGNDRLIGSNIDLGAYEASLITRYYVDSSNVSGIHDGSNWATAFNKFEDAINAVRSGDTIFVAKGTYQPVQDSFFTMIKNVKIYGGFAGTETDLGQRDLNAGNTTTLQGNGNRVISNDDNALSNTALLDGFTISNGNAQKGGGVYNNNVSPSFANCVFINNHADIQGGGMHNEFSSNPVISNCIFYNNDAGTGGGGVFNYYGSSPNISQSTFIGNSSTNGGGIGTNNNANATIVNCEFKWNTASGGGGAINNNTSDGVKIINSLFIRNKATDNGGGVNNLNSSSFIVNCTFSQDTVSAGGAINNTNSNPVIKNCIISGNTSGVANSSSAPVITFSLIQGMAADTVNHNLDGSRSPYFLNVANDSYGLTSCSPAINAGDSDTTGLGLPDFDLLQQPRIFGGVIDMGVFEAPYSSNAVHVFDANETQPSCNLSDGIIYLNGNFINQPYTLSYTLNNVRQSTELLAASGVLYLSALSSGTYGNFMVSNTNGCQDSLNQNPIVLGNQDPNDFNNLADDGSSVSQWQGDNITQPYVSSDCKLLTSIETNPTNDSLGFVTAKVHLYQQTPVFNNEPFVARYYELEASQNSGAIVTLYFTDDEIQNYNQAAINANQPAVLEPQSGISNLLIMAYHETGNGGPDGNFDVNSGEVISPISVTHINDIWSVRFYTNSFSGFFAYTNTNNAALPISLVDIKAQNIGEQNIIRWKTANENVGDHFEIERSRDGKTFKNIGSIDASGIPQGDSYQLIDKEPFIGINFYRLKMINIGRTTIISKIVTATLQPSDFEITAHPNPVDDQLQIKINGEIVGHGALRLIDITGKIIYTQNVQNNEKISIPMGNLAPEIYFLQYKDDVHIKTIKVIKK